VATAAADYDNDGDMDILQAGSYQVSMDVAHLPNGLYLYELKAGDFLQTRKMFVGKD
jgi:hypothetical protein